MLQRHATYVFANIITTEVYWANNEDIIRLDNRFTISLVHWEKSLPWRWDFAFHESSCYVMKLSTTSAFMKCKISGLKTKFLPV